MYKPYLSRQKSGKSVQTTASAGDKTTLKLVTEQLRASQKVLNKSDQFIPVVPVARGGAGGARAAFAGSSNESGGWGEQPMREEDETAPVCRPTGHPASPAHCWVRNSNPGAGFFFLKQESCDTLS